MNDILLLARCRALGGVAFDQFVGHHSGEDDDAEDGVFEVGGNAEHVNGIINKTNDRRGNDDAEDTALATAQAATAEHGGGDGIEFIKFAGLRRLHGI